MLRIDSDSDLAIVSVTPNRQGTALAMENFMSLHTLHEGVPLAPAGS